MSPSHFQAAIANIKREWAAVSANPERYQVWLDLFRGKEPALPLAGNDHEGERAAKERFQPLWSASETPEAVVSPTRLVEWYNRQPWCRAKPGEAPQPGDEDQVDLEDVVALVQKPKQEATPQARGWSDENLIVRCPPPPRTGGGEQDGDADFGDSTILIWPIRHSQACRLGEPLARAEASTRTFDGIVVSLG